jgi:sphingolipid delta-4 desaturase
VRLVGSSTVRKAAWLFLNMFILPIRSLYKVKVEANGFVILNWVVCFATVAAVAWASFPALLFLALSLFMSQGFHPANARQLQRHYWDGSAGKAVNGQGGAAMTFSYYGWTNALFLNVGYHNEHHDFVQVAWTRLPALRALVGDAYYPDSAAYASRGMADLINFVTSSTSRTWCPSAGCGRAFECIKKVDIISCSCLQILKLLLRCLKYSQIYPSSLAISMQLFLYITHL